MMRTEASTGISTGDVEGGVKVLLRLEGVALFVAAIWLYGRASGDWRLFAILFLVPDLSFAFYLAGSRASAAAYNAMHSTIAPIVLACAGFAWGIAPFLAVALIWAAHVGFDRALGFGLKYASGFSHTHLGRIGHHAQRAQ